MGCLFDGVLLLVQIIDGWRLRKSWYWDDGHDDVLRQIVRVSRSGTEVTEFPKAAARFKELFGLPAALAVKN